MLDQVVPGVQSYALPLVTIVVPAYNEEGTLKSCLNSLLKQNYEGETEIVVVDNASDDRTAEIAASYGCRVIYEGHRGYNYSVKRGFDQARGSIIACTDADSFVPSNWISRIVKHLSRKDIVACTGIFNFHDGPFWLRATGRLFGALNYHLAGANMAVKRDAYHQVGGFSTKINLGADVHLGMRLKKIGKVKIDRRLIVRTSSRRFHRAFWKTLAQYYLNDVALIILGRPIFYSFKAYR